MLYCALVLVLFDDLEYVLSAWFAGVRSTNSSLRQGEVQYIFGRGVESIER